MIVREKTSASNERENYNFIRDKKMDTGFRYVSKRNSASGRTLGLRSPDRKLSNTKRNEESLEKEEEKAKLMNAQLITNMMKQQHAPNYLQKFKNRKVDSG